MFNLPDRHQHRHRKHKKWKNKKNNKKSDNSPDIFFFYRNTVISYIALSFYRFTAAGPTCFFMESWGLVLSALLWESVLTDAVMFRFQLWILLQLDLLTLSMLVLSGRLWQARVTDCLMPRNGKSAAKLSKRTAPHPLSDRYLTCKLLLAPHFWRVQIVQSVLTTFQPNLP